MRFVVVIETGYIVHEFEFTDGECAMEFAIVAREHAVSSKEDGYATTVKIIVKEEK